MHWLNQSQLAKTMFPVGELHKTEQYGASRKRQAAECETDSTGICFIGERPFRRVPEPLLEQELGPILDDQGRQVGEHGG